VSDGHGEELNDFTRLVGNIREELHAQNALRGLELPSELIDELAEKIAVNIDYAFEVRWSPRWEGRRKPPESN
jgi:hypothetical protein